MTTKLGDFYRHAFDYHHQEPTSNTTYVDNRQCSHHEAKGFSAIAVILGITVVAAFIGLVKGFEDACERSKNGEALRQVTLLKDATDVEKDSYTKTIMAKHEEIASRKLQNGRVFVGCAAAFGAATVAQCITKSGFFVGIMALSVAASGFSGLRSSYNVPQLTKVEREIIRTRAMKDI